MFHQVERALDWLRSKLASAVQAVLLAVLAVGPIPKHVAFVMDGNRRYARRKNRNVSEGHSDGFVALTRVGCSLFWHKTYL
jgi:ditrans,polycis-polyprenyl diphosphate synthase